MHSKDIPEFPRDEPMFLSPDPYNKPSPTRRNPKDDSYENEQMSDS